MPRHEADEFLKSFPLIEEGFQTHLMCKSRDRLKKELAVSSKSVLLMQADQKSSR